MQTEPEQWAVELMEAALAVFCENTTEDGALVIQRAFEDQTRKLREAATALVAALESDKHYFGDEYNALRQALKETSDAG